MAKIIKVRNVNIGQGRPKICAIVMGETAEEILSLAERSNSVECDMIEFRVDHFAEVFEPDRVKSLLRKIRRIALKPMIFTFRRKEEGGKVETTLQYYKELLTMVAENSLADIIDVEASAVEDDSEFIPSIRDTGAFVIISKHDFSRTPSEAEIVRIYMEMQKMGADIIKVAFMPNSKKDVLSLINATEEMTSNFSSCPVVAISMGHLGMITRIMGEFLESVITFAAITKSSAPGQINIDGLEQILDIIHENYKTIFLVGFMGAGKTSVANMLALNYGLKKVDLDAVIEQKEGMSISELRSNSETAFHEKESKYLRHVLKQNYQVVSMGMGIVTKNENIDMMKEKGVIVFLKASPETIEKRLKNDMTRSVLSDFEGLDYMTELMKERDEMYMEVADYVIETDNKNIEEICKEIVETLGFTM